jgi:hypothetical protein
MTLAQALPGGSTMRKTALLLITLATAVARAQQEPTTGCVPVNGTKM